MNPYDGHLTIFQCASMPEMYSEMTDIAKERMELDKLPFPLSALEHPPGNAIFPEINAFI